MVILGEFDYGKYLASKNIYGSISSYSAQKIATQKGNFLLKYIYKFRDIVAKRIDKELSGDEAELLKGMIYGDTKDLDEGIKETFTNIGISHLTAVSGSNVSTLIIIFTIIFSKIKVRKLNTDISILLVIVIFCIISSLELSIVRATIMTSILVISKLMDRKISIYTTLVITITLILIVNPMAMFNVGLILSFFATLSIVMFAMPIKEGIDNIVKKIVIRENLLKLIGYITIPMSVTIAANILIFPITICFFGKFPGIFLVSNVIASYLETGIRVLGTVGIMLIKVPIISNILFQISGVLCNSLIHIARLLDKISMIIYFRQPTYLFLVIYYLIFFCAYIKVEKKRIEIKQNIEGVRERNAFIQKSCRLIKFIERKIKIRSIEKTLFVILLIYIIFTKVYYIFFDNYVYFLNVGQGELAAIKTRDSFGIIDIGSTKEGLAASTLINFMKNRNIKKIDYIVISHMHEDHMNGAIEILKRYEVDSVIYSYPSKKKETKYLELIDSIVKSGAKPVIVQSGDKISIGKHLNINILLAGQGKIIDKDMENANSIILEMVSSKKKIIFMGDSTKVSENILIKNLSKQKYFEKSNTGNTGLKVGHHGSKTSTSEEFLKKFNFSFAIISAKKKEFGHPSEVTLDLLTKYMIIKYITEKDGALKYSLN